MPSTLELDSIDSIETRLTALEDRAAAMRAEFSSDGEIDAEEREALDRIEGKIARMRDLLTGARAGAGAGAGGQAAAAPGGGGPAPAGAATGGAAAPAAAPAEEAPAPASAGADDGAGGGPAAAAAPTGKTAPVDLKAGAEDKLRDAEGRLSRTAELIAAFEAIVPGSADPTPADWGTRRTAIDATLAPMRGAAGTIDETALDAALKDLAALETAIRDLSAKKAAWKTAHDAFKARFAVLERHPQAGAAPEIKPKIDAIRTDLSAAEAKAAAHDFDRAAKDLEPLGPRCDTVEAQADHFAQYSAILPQRTTLVNASLGVITGDAELDRAQRKMEDLLNKAAADVAADRFEDAVKKLDEILPLSEKRDLIDVCKNSYLSQDAAIQPRIQALVALPGDIKAPFSRAITDAKNIYEKSKYSRTGDYVKSDRELDKFRTWQTNNVLDKLEADTLAHQTYKNDLKAFETQFNKLKSHKGRSGIEAFFLGMQSDLDLAKAEADALRFAAGSAILVRTQPDWAAEETKADDCRDYKDRRKAVEPLIEKERKRAIPAAEGAIAQADTLMARAVTQAGAQDFAGALASVEAAATRAAEAKTAGDKAEALGKLKDGRALDNIARDFDKAYKVFTDMRAHVAGEDAGGHLAALIAKADDPAQKAEDEAAKPAPDFTAARGHLDAAIALLEEAHAKVLARAPYEAHLATAIAMRDTTLPPLDVDDCIKDRIDAITALITGAEDLAKPDGHDYAAAETKLGEAMDLATLAEAEGALWPAIKRDHDTIKLAIADIVAEPTVVPLMAKRDAELDAIIDEVDALVAGKDFRAAAEKAAVGAAMRPRTQGDVATMKVIAARKITDYDNRITGVEGNASVTDHVQDAKDRIGEYQDELDEGNYRAAARLFWEATYAIDRAEAVLAAETAYETQRAAAETAIATADAVRNPGIETALAALEARYAAAVAEAAPNHYRKPQREMTAIQGEAGALPPLAAAYAGFEAVAQTARDKLAEAEAHAHAEAVRPMLDRLAGKERNATALAASDVATAMRMMGEVAAGAAEAIESADRAEIVAGINDAIGASSDLTGVTMVQMAAAWKMHEHLSAKPEAYAAQPALDEARTAFTTAEAGGTAPADAVAALKAGLAKCTEADETISRHRMLDEAAAAVKAEIAALRGHAAADVIADDLAGLGTAVDEALASAVHGDNYDMASAELEMAMTGCHEARALADAHSDYVALRDAPDVTPRLAALEAHPHCYAIRANIDTMRAKLDAAAGKAEARDYPAATALLTEAKAIGVSALVMADMRGNTAPTVANVKAILDGPGGAAELDAMIAELEPDAQRAVIRVAFEARFGCELEYFANEADRDAGTPEVADGTNTGPNLKRFYELMSDLPSAAVTDSDGMQLFQVVQSGSGSFYASDEKALVMIEGDHETSANYGFGLRTELDNVEGNCRPANEDPVSFFSWNTLHEVGHAVDDNHGFMDGKGDKEEYGGWTAYNTNVAPIAAKVASAFGYDEGYVGDYMTGVANPAIPAKPASESCSDEEWESRRIAARAWVDAARVTNKPWQSSGTAKRLVIDGIAYHEAYPNSWVSYSFAARRKGITGYQFRAPGEWFSEIYAAYHSGKLKSTHPAASWLKDLDAPGA